MKLYCLIFLFLVSTITDAVPVKLKIFVDTFVQNKSEKEALSGKMLEITEVKQLSKDETKNKKVFVMVTAKPTHSNPYYEISVGYKDQSGYDTKYIFQLKKSEVNKSNIEPYLEILDVNLGKYVPLTTFRKNK